MHLTYRCIVDQRATSWVYLLFLQYNVELYFKAKQSFPIFYFLLYEQKKTEPSVTQTNFKKDHLSSLQPFLFTSPI